MTLDCQVKTLLQIEWKVRNQSFVWIVPFCSFEAFFIILKKMMKGSKMLVYADFRNIKCINRFGKTYAKQLQSCEVLRKRILTKPILVLFCRWAVQKMKKVNTIN